MLFGRDPDVAIRPGGEGAKLLNRGMGVRHAVADGEGGGVEDTDVAAKTVQDAGGFEGHELGIRPISLPYQKLTSKIREEGQRGIGTVSADSHRVLKP